MRPPGCDSGWIFEMFSNETATVASGLEENAIKRCKSLLKTFENQQKPLSNM